ncbi:MAG: DUF692 domain-containing protein [Pseudomonadota bacterium]|nr:MAG: DUF692 domain-containing protein [Pseudomonadota bacterium]
MQELHGGVRARSCSGVGLGLRAPHYAYVEEHRPEVPWFEVLVDNYIGKGGAALHHLETIRSDYPFRFHGVGMSLGSTDPLDMSYLAGLRALIDRFEPDTVSDHLCWTSVGGIHTHELLPLPCVEEAVAHVAARIDRVQDYLGRPILVENVSSYLTYRDDAFTEWEFLDAVAERADCGVLLDINNIQVSAHNHGFDAHAYLQGVDPKRVGEFHLAGYEDQGSYLLDTHGEPVHAPVWELYRAALRRFGAVPTLIEWDTNLPKFERLQEEADTARIIRAEELADAA